MSLPTPEPMSYVQTDIVETATPKDDSVPGVWLLQDFVLLMLIAFVYQSILARLAANWWNDPNFSRRYWEPEKAESFFHSFSGWIIFLLSLAMLFLLHRAFNILRRWSVHESLSKVCQTS
jgi:hypothetical protein